MSHILKIITVLIILPVPNILTQIHIPSDLTYDKAFFTPSYNTIYDANRTVYIGKIPIQIAPLYEEFIKDVQSQDILKDSDYEISSQDYLTLLSTILAIHYTESRFNPNASTSSGAARGLGQLHITTAKWLLKVDKETFGKLYYVSNNKVFYKTSEIQSSGQYHRNQKIQHPVSINELGKIYSQILVTSNLLLHYKYYNTIKPFKAVKNYNGSGIRATNYAILVLKRSILFQLKIMEASGAKLSDDYQELIHKIIYGNIKFKRLLLGNITKNTNLSQNEVMAILNDVESSLTYTTVKTNDTKFLVLSGGSYGETSTNLLYEKGIKLKDFRSYTAGNCQTYLNVFFKRRSIFSYFYNLTDFTKTFCMEENLRNGFYTYYLENNKEIRLNDQYDIPKFKNKTLFVHIPDKQVQNLNKSAIKSNLGTYFTIIIPRGIIVRIEDNRKEISIVCN